MTTWSHDVFVSYSQRDKPMADAVVAGLEQASIRCWVAPRDITAGASWAGAIMAAISATRAMVVVLSASSNSSDQVIREVERAVAAGRTIVPFRIEEIAPSGPMAYFLGTQHWLDAITPPLNRHIEQLAGTLRALLQQPPLEGEPAAGSPVQDPSRGAGVAAGPVGGMAKGRSGGVIGRRRLKRWQVVALIGTGVGVVAAAALGVILVARPGDGEESATTLAGSTSVPTTAPSDTSLTSIATTTASATSSSTTTAVTGLVPELAWTRVPHDELVLGGGGHQIVKAATAGGPGVVAVGCEMWPAGLPDAVVWTSVNGVDWQRTLVQRMGCMNDVALWSGGLVAVGWADGAAAVWTSDDGLVWSKVPPDPAIFNVEGGVWATMQSVAAGGPGLIAVGGAEMIYADTAIAQTVVWASADGRTWTRMEVDDDVAGTYATSLVAFQERLIMVGRAGESDLSGDAAVWTSLDGLVWTRVSDDTGVLAGVPFGEMVEAAVGGPGVLAVGRASGGSAVWYSADGLTWYQVRKPPDVSDMYDVAAVGTGAVAVGSVCTGPKAAVWVSEDGVTWPQIPSTDGVFSSSPIPARNDSPTGDIPQCVGMTAVAAAGPGVVVFGLDGSGGDLDVAVWVATVDLTP